MIISKWNDKNRFFDLILTDNSSSWEDGSDLELSIHFWDNVNKKAEDFEIDQWNEVPSEIVNSLLTDIVLRAISFDDLKREFERLEERL